MTDVEPVNVLDIAFEAIPFPAGGASQALYSRSCLVGGWSFKETTGGAPASLALVDGQDARSVAYAFIELSAGQSIRDALPAPGLYFRQGLFVVVNSGSVQGSAWVRAL